jgi:hypothetical protein
MNELTVILLCSSLFGFTMMFIHIAKNQDLKHELQITKNRMESEAIAYKNTFEKFKEEMTKLRADKVSLETLLYEIGEILPKRFYEEEDK